MAAGRFVQRGRRLAFAAAGHPPGNAGLECWSPPARFAKRNPRLPRRYSAI
jgi:hypothetical protein